MDRKCFKFESTDTGCLLWLKITKVSANIPTVHLLVARLVQPWHFCGCCLCTQEQTWGAPSLHWCSWGSSSSKSWLCHAMPSRKSGVRWEQNWKWHCTNTGSDTCPQSRHGLRAPKHNCQLSNEVPKFPRDLHHWAEWLLCHRFTATTARCPHAAPLTHLFNVPRGSWAVAPGTGHIHHGCARAPGAEPPCLWLGQGCRTGMGAKVQAAAKRSVSMANHLLCFLYGMYPGYELSTQCTVGSTTFSLYLFVWLLIVAGITEALKLLWSSHRTGNLCLIVPRRTDPYWDCNSESGKCIRHIKVEQTHWDGQ